MCQVETCFHHGRTQRESNNCLSSPFAGLSWDVRSFGTSGKVSILNRWSHHQTFSLACSPVTLSGFLSSEQLLVAGSAVLSKPPEDRDVEDPSDQLGTSRDGRLYQQMECVCYGLGSFSSCVSARFQLAMLLLLLDAGQVRGHDYRMRLQTLYTRPCSL